MPDFVNITFNRMKIEQDFNDVKAMLFLVYPHLLPYKKHLFIAGGSIRSMILNEQVKDVDIFIKDSKYLKEIMDVFFYGAFISDNAININGIYTSLNNCGPTKIQIIHNQIGSPMEIINQFDFTMNMNYYDFETDDIHVENLPDILSKTLRINKHCRNKLGTLARIVKFTERGYRLYSKENLLELGCQLTRMEPINTFTELEQESRLYFSNEEYDLINFVDKDVESSSKYQSRMVGSGL